MESHPHIDGTVTLMLMIRILMEGLSEARVLKRELWGILRREVVDWRQK